MLPGRWIWAIHLKLSWKRLIGSLDLTGALPFLPSSQITWDQVIHAGAMPSNLSQTTQGNQVSNSKKKNPPAYIHHLLLPLLLFLVSRRKKGKKKFKGNLKPLHTPNEKIKMDVAGSCVLYVSKYFHLLLKFPLGVAKNSYRIVNTMVNLDSFYGETFPHPLKSLVSICPVTDKPEVLLDLPFCSLGWDQGREAAPTF